MTDPGVGVGRLAELLGVAVTAGGGYDWDEIERGVGLRLPADYKLIADSLPSGWVRGFARLSKPQRPRGAPQRLDVIIGDPPFYPEPGGTVSWGETADGWTCGWAPVSADPDEWEVVAAGPTGGYMRGTGLSFSTALWQYAARDPLAMIRPRVLPKRPARFTPGRSA